MDFLSNLSKTATDDDSKPKPSEPKPSSEPKPTSSHLLSSCKIVAEAAQSQFRNEPEKYDKAKVASASADILDAAEKYGKLDETKGIGKYVEQAEDYLRQYGTSKPAVASAAGEPSPAAVPEAKEPEKKPEGEGGAGDYIKMAQGFMNKPSGGGGAGDFMKMAGDFLKK